MNKLLAAFFVLHGIAHGVGFVVPWRLMEVEETAYSTTLLAGRWDVGDVGIRLVGLLWLATGLAFVAAGAGVWMLKGWWTPAATAAATASLVLSMVLAALLSLRLGWWSL